MLQFLNVINTQHKNSRACLHTEVRMLGICVDGDNAHQFLLHEHYNFRLYYL